MHPATDTDKTSETRIECMNTIRQAGIEYPGSQKASASSQGEQYRITLSAARFAISTRIPISAGEGDYAGSDVTTETGSTAVRVRNSIGPDGPLCVSCNRDHGCRIDTSVRRWPLADLTRLGEAEW